MTLVFWLILGATTILLCVIAILVCNYRNKTVCRIEMIDCCAPRRLVDDTYFLEFGGYSVRACLVGGSTEEDIYVFEVLDPFDYPNLVSYFVKVLPDRRGVGIGFGWLIYILVSYDDRLSAGQKKELAEEFRSCTRLKGLDQNPS